MKSTDLTKHLDIKAKIAWLSANSEHDRRIIELESLNRKVAYLTAKSNNVIQFPARAQ